MSECEHITEHNEGVPSDGQPFMNTWDADHLHCRNCKKPWMDVEVEHLPIEKRERRKKENQIDIDFGRKFRLAKTQMEIEEIQKEKMKALKLLS